LFNLQKRFCIPFKLILKISKRTFTPRFKIQFKLFEFLGQVVHRGTGKVRFPVFLNQVMVSL